MNAKEARKLLLSGAAPLLRELLREATGELRKDGQGYFSIDKKSREVVLAAILPMIQAAGDAQKMEASTTADIIALLKDGAITIQDAKELMGILAVKNNIENPGIGLLPGDGHFSFQFGNSPRPPAPKVVNGGTDPKTIDQLEKE